MSKYFNLFVRIWKLLKPFHKVFYIQLILISILGAMDIYRRVLIGHVIDVTGTKDYNSVIITCIYFVAFVALYWTLDFYKDYNYALKFKRTVYQTLREFSLRKVLNLNIFQFYESNSTIRYDVVATGEDRSVVIIEQIILQILPSIVLFVSAGFALYGYSPTISLLCIMGCILIFTIEMIYMSKMRPVRRVVIDNNREQYKIALEAFTHLPLIRTLGIENKFIIDFLAKRKVNLNFNLKIDKKDEIYAGIRNYILVIMNLACTFLAIKYFIAGSINLGSIFVIFSITNDVFIRAKNLQSQIGRIAINYIDVEKYLNLIDMQPEFDENGKSKFSTGDIVITNLNFKYPNTDDYVIKDFNLTILNGQRVAFVGHSGSGKSTIIKLLLRAYDYTNSSIKINNIELRDINSHDLRSHIGYVEQHVDLFDTTVRDNILMSVDEKTIKQWGENSDIYIDTKLEEVARLARIDEFYHRLGEKRFDTEIGERGIKLSGGERQRVGIARAIIKDPSILIFDEATSSLDTINEKYIKEAVDNVSRGRTTIIVAHRLSTVEDADMIIVMNRGTIVATGTHNQLLSSSTHYQELIAAQLK